MMLARIVPAEAAIECGLLVLWHRDVHIVMCSLLSFAHIGAISFQFIDNTIIKQDVTVFRTAVLCLQGMTVYCRKVDVV